MSAHALQWGRLLALVACLGTAIATAEETTDSVPPLNPADLPETVEVPSSAPPEAPPPSTSPSPETTSIEIAPVESAPPETTVTDPAPALPSLGTEDLNNGTPKKESFWQKLHVTGYLKNETAYRYREPRSVTKIRNIAYLHLQYPYSDTVKFTYAGWAYHDAAYDLFDYDTIAARLEREAADSGAISGSDQVFSENLRQQKDSPRAQTRELYVDVFLKSTDIRVGKQYVVWGVLEGVRITDEINPIDFRELILPELIDYRVPLWTLKLDHYRGDDTYQLLWIPDTQFHKPAPPGSEWEMLQEVPGTRYPDQYSLRNSSLGLKYSSTLWDTEISLSYLYTWDQFPTIFRALQIGSVDATPANLATTIPATFFATYTRIHMFGGTAVKQVGPVILKGEAAYVADKYFGLRNDVDRNNDGYLDDMGEIKRNHLRLGLGVDYNYKGWDLSPVVTVWHIFDYDSGLIQEQNDTAVSLFVRKEFPQRSAIFTLLMVHLVHLHETYLKPKITFQVTDKFQIATGLDMFAGPKSILGDDQSTALGAGVLSASQQRAQFLGNFANNDRMFIEFKYSF